MAKLCSKTSRYIEKIKFSGFLAQEVESAALESNFDFSGVRTPENNSTPYSLSYAEFVVPLVKAVQEQQDMIELLKDGVAFVDGDYMFGSDRYIDLLGIEGNEFDVETFNKLVVKEDLLQYEMVVSKTTKRNPVYTINYRVQRGNQLLWMKETGKALFIDKEKRFVRIIRPMDVQLFPTTEVDVLNNLPSSKLMFDEMQKIVDRVEIAVRKRDGVEIKSSQLGTIVMRELKKVNKVAYIRFASVYKEFADLEEFEDEVHKLIRKKK